MKPATCQMVRLALIATASLALDAPVRAADAQAPYADRGELVQYLSADPMAEIAAARSAAPHAVSDQAEILVLNRDGFVPAVHGTNGFVCYVGRSWEKDFRDPEFWNPKVRTPQCWNAAAAGSLLPRYLERTRWVLAGVAREDMAARSKAAWATHRFDPPAQQSMAFMMSKDQYISDPSGGGQARWYPHVMFFVSTDADSTWGANAPGSPIFASTSADDPVTTFFVVVPRWSDGSLGPYVEPAPTAPASGVDGQHRH